MKEYEIWIGFCDFGQGYAPSTEPQLVGKVTAKDFKTACFKYELKNKLDCIEEQERTGQYISNQDYEWFYDPRVNGTAWLGKYFETKEEAQKTFQS